MENANSILELSKRALELFQKQDSEQKRRLLNLLVSNCSYKNENIDVELKPVFNEILKTTKTRNWCALSVYFRTFSFEYNEIKMLEVQSLVNNLNLGLL